MQLRRHAGSALCSARPGLCLNSRLARDTLLPAAGFQPRPAVSWRQRSAAHSRAPTSHPSAMTLDWIGLRPLGLGFACGVRISSRSVYPTRMRLRRRLRHSPRLATELSRSPWRRTPGGRPVPPSDLINCPASTHTRASCGSSFASHWNYSTSGFLTPNSLRYLHGCRGLLLRSRRRINLSRPAGGSRYGCAVGRRTERRPLARCARSRRRSRRSMARTGFASRKCGGHSVSTAR